MMKIKNKTLKKKAKDLLWEHDLDVAKLARRINKSRTWTSQVLYGNVPSEDTRMAIVKILGEYIWPNKHKKAA